MDDKYIRRIGGGRNMRVGDGGRGLNPRLPQQEADRSRLIQQALKITAQVWSLEM